VTGRETRRIVVVASRTVCIVKTLRTKEGLLCSAGTARFVWVEECGAADAPLEAKVGVPDALELGKQGKREWVVESGRCRAQWGE
jgi:hypothetical protein